MPRKKLNLTERICKDCGILKPIKEFPLVRTRGGAPVGQEYRTYYKTWCIVCEIERARKRRLQPGYKEQERLAARLSRKKKPEYYLWCTAKKRAHATGVPFTIDPEDIFIPTHCPILNIPLKSYQNGFKLDSMSLDKIENSKGYIKGNIAVISRLANQMKSCATKSQLKLFAKNILPYLHDYTIKRKSSKSRTVPKSNRIFQKV